jgi:hypothetical protein
MRQRHSIYRENKRIAPRIRRREAAAPGHKWCARCRHELPFQDFGRNRASRDGRTTYCRPCHAAAGREARDRNGGARNYHLLRRYGITAAEYDERVVAQDGLCAVCHDRKPEHVDHDHKTGEVRGLLCSCCNQGLGNFRDNSAHLRAAANYLDRTRRWRCLQPGVYALVQSPAA